MVVSYQIIACQCRLGSCLQLPADAADVLSVAEEDGTLTIDSTNGGQYHGGIDADGSYWAGAYSEVTRNVYYERQRGRFQIAGGQPYSIDTTHEVTWLTNLVGNVDCDFTARSSARYQGPLAASSFN